MGIIIGDTITLDNGLSANNTYGSFGDSELIVQKIETDPESTDQNDSFRVSCRGSIWTTKEYRDSSKPKIHSVYVSVNIGEEHLNSNLYGILYTNWKNTYTNITDSEQ